MLEYFGEDVAMTSDVFFSTLSKFVRDFSDTRDLVERKQKAEMRRVSAVEKSGSNLLGGKSSVKASKTLTGTNLGDLHKEMHSIKGDNGGTGERQREGEKGKEKSPRVSKSSMRRASTCSVPGL